MTYENYLNRYPFAKVNDYIKTIYQGFMGPAHLVDDYEKAYNRLERECSELIVDGFIHIEFEYLSDRFYRMHFVSKSNYRFKVSTVIRMFMVSARIDEDLEGLREFLNGIVLMGQDQLYVENYLEDIKAISHSDEFKEKYNPRYRVVSKEYFEFADLYEKIDNQDKKLVINIDGNSGSGKSTLANKLSEVYDCDIIHADDFYLQEHQRTEARLKEVGGNIDYERFKDEIIENIAKDFTYRKYDCMSKSFSSDISVSSSLIIVEGSYSSHPYFGDYADIRVFLSIDKERQYQRILNRNGEKIFPRFKNEWIPKEDEYFEKFEILDKSDLTYFV